MPDDPSSPESHGPVKVRTLIEVGRRTINVAYLIQSHQVGHPDPRREVDVTLEFGDRFRLRDDEAELFLTKVAEFVPRQVAAQLGAATVTTTIIRPDTKPDSAEG